MRALLLSAALSAAPASTFLPPVSDDLAAAFQPVLASLDSTYGVRHLDLSDPRQRDSAAPILQALAAYGPQYLEPATYRDPAVAPEMKTAWLIMVMGEADELVWEKALPLIDAVKNAREIRTLAPALGRLQRFDGRFLPYLANEGLGAEHARIVEETLRDGRTHLRRMYQNFNDRVEQAIDGYKNAS